MVELDQEKMACFSSGFIIFLPKKKNQAGGYELFCVLALNVVFKLPVLMFSRNMYYETVTSLIIF